MSHIQSFYKALKMSCLHKLLDPFNHSPWKLLLLGYIQKWGGSNILYLSKQGLAKKAEKVNRFFLFIRVETGKGGVGGNSTRLEPAHMVKPFDKNRCV